VRVILRWGDADAIKLSRPYANLFSSMPISEFRILPFLAGLPFVRHFAPSLFVAGGSTPLSQSPMPGFNCPAIVIIWAQGAPFTSRSMRLRWPVCWPTERAYSPGVGPGSDEKGQPLASPYNKCGGAQ
jgi:hypothetical protein